MTQKPPWIQERDHQRFVNFAIIVGILSVLGMFVYLLAQSPAKAGDKPQWDGLASDANHACYHDGGVQQVTGYITGEGFVFVCRDGWAMRDENS